jgi:hypothetical protein
MTNEELREKCEGALVACHPCEEMMDIARACLALLEANRWRKCEEEMPEPGIPVLAWSRDYTALRSKGCNAIRIARREADEEGWWYELPDGNEIEVPEWWCPPPEPPDA